MQYAFYVSKKMQYAFYLSKKNAVQISSKNLFIISHK